MMENNSTGQYADVNGLKMYYEIHGTGKPLVLIHGGGSTINTTFEMVLPAFAKSYQVIAVELQAHGHTADIDRAFSFEQDADDVVGLLGHLKIVKAFILGFSNGGSTALQIAMRHPDLVDKLIVISGMYKREDLYPWFWEMMQNPTFNDMPSLYKEAYLKISGNTQEGLLAMYHRDTQRMIHFKSWKDEEIQSIKVPALVISADQDVVPPEGAVELHRQLPKGRLAIFPGGHGECLGEIMTRNERSEAKAAFFVAMVDEFLG